MFKDEATIELKAGDGGDGSISFRHEKFVPKGGPDGGDGGAGGDIILVVGQSTYGLNDFVRQKNWKAEGGKGGMKARKTGSSGEDLVLKVPLGTQVYDHATKRLLADLNKLDDQFKIARGGKGGRGNWHFATAVLQAPRIAQSGFPGEEKTIDLVLKMIADVGLVGFPNSGKSTLLARITAAKPKVANYPFTTLAPNIGIAQWRDHRFIVADIPGLIEGASAGRGLGHKFLRHVERTRILVHLISAESTDFKADYKTIREELKEHDLKLLEKPEIVVISKIDIDKPKKVPKGWLTISSASGEGVDQLLDEIISHLK